MPRKTIKKATPEKSAVEEVKVKGVADHVTKQGDRNNTLVAGEVRVGCSKGATFNMGNYQSARIDYWIERVVPDDKKEVAKAYSEMSDELDELINQEAEEIGVTLD